MENNFDAMCMLAGKGTSRLWIQGGDPSQIKVVSLNEMCWNAGVLTAPTDATQYPEAGTLILEKIYFTCNSEVKTSQILACFILSIFI